MPANKTRNTLARQWELLQLIPTRGDGKTSSEFTDALNQLGFKVSKRQMERDLGALMEAFPLECNNDSIPFFWKWIDGASVDLPGLTLAEALSMKLIEDAIQNLLPASLVSSLKSRFLQAEKKLAGLDKDNPTAQWSSKVRTVQPTLPLLPPQVIQEVLENVQEALLLNKQLEAEYQSMTDSAPVSKLLNPLGLVNRGPVTYLVATKSNSAEVRLYALHRFAKAAKLEGNAKRPRTFNLDDYINSGALQFGSRNTIRLKAYVSDWLAQYLTETPMSSDQKIVVEGKKIRLSATVPDSWQLKWWILSHGSGIKVLAPVGLRSSIFETHKLASAQYEESDE